MIIGLAGDVMIGRLVNEHLRTVSPSYIWGDLLPLLQATDFNLINLEAALTFSEERVDKTFNFKSDPQHVASLKAARIDMVNLANNHVLDYEEKGLLETLKTLDAAGILHVGAGENQAQATSPAFFECRGLKIGVLGCTDNEPNWSATAKKPGTFYIDVGDLQALETPIRHLRSQVDLLILSIHWGPNMRQRPTQEFRQFAHQLIDLGVDLIHGHSAHIIQGIENYRGKWILYDTGDFVDDYAVDPILRNDHSFFFQLEATPKGISHLQLFPTRIHNFQVTQMKHPTPHLERMQQLCHELATPSHIHNNTLQLSNS